MIGLLLDLIIAVFVFCLGAAALYCIFWLPIMAIGSIIGKIADARDARRGAKLARKIDMEREYQVIQGSGHWVAQMRFVAPDEELRAASILPGWHTIKYSVRREVAEHAVKLAKANNQ